MKPTLLLAALANLTSATLFADLLENGAPERKPTSLETSLVGNWFTSGDPGKQAHIASSGSKLFAISEVFETLELLCANNGSVVAERPGCQITGVVTGDFILWSNGTWWARHPVPSAPDDLVIWNDPGSGWIPLKSVGKSAMQGDTKIHWNWGGPEAPRMGGKLYRRDQFLFAHAPADLKFAFEKPITEFRAVIGLIEGGRLGSVVFKVRTDDGVVFTSNQLRHDRGNTQRVEIKFAPTKTLELITDPGENNYEDWSNWLAPEVK